MCLVVVRMEDGSSEVQQAATAVTLMAPGSLQQEDRKAACRRIKRQPAEGSKGSPQKDEKAACRGIKKQPAEGSNSMTQCH